MARKKPKQQGKNNANTGKVPQEVAKDKSSLQSVTHEDHQLAPQVTPLSKYILPDSMAYATRPCSVLITETIRFTSWIVIGKCKQSSYQVFDILPMRTVWPYPSRINASVSLKFNMWTQLMTSTIPIRPQTSTLCQVMPEALPKIHRQMILMTSLVPIRPQTSTILQVTPEALPKFHWQTQLITSLIPIWPQTSKILQVTPEALPKFNMWPQLMASLVPIRPQTSTLHDSSGYAGGAAQIPHANTINDKSCPNSTTNNQDSSGYSRGTAQIP